MLPWRVDRENEDPFGFRRPTRRDSELEAQTSRAAVNPRLLLLTAVAGSLAFVTYRQLRPAVFPDLPPPRHQVIQPEPLRLAGRSPKAEHSAARFNGLEPRLQEIALHLETLAIAWEARPPMQAPDESWSRYALEQVAPLDTSQISALATWMAELPSHGFTEAERFRVALYKTWGARDPKAAREQIEDRYRNLNSKEEGMEGVNIPLDWVSSDFHSIQIGRALSDPAAAWEDFRKNDSDNALKALNNADVTLPPIFEKYAAVAPGEAWDLFLKTGDGPWAIRMLQGFAKGAPAGQDWLTLGRQLLESPNAGPNQDWKITTLAARWLAESPDAALEWYASHASSSQPALDPADRQAELKAKLIESSSAAIAAIDHLISRGEAGDQAVVRRVFPKFAGYTSYYSELFPLIPKIRDTTVREEALLEIIRRLPTYSREGDRALPGPNPWLGPEKQLAAGIELSPATEAKIETIFRRVEILEEENRHALPAE